LRVGLIGATNDMVSSMRQLPFELWGGVECTVNRVHDTYFDQTKKNGHETRIEDLELFASLGITAIRYPVLWERTAPNSLDEMDWSWADERLHRLRELGVEPIVGLVHHGSGPRYTSLVDAGFAPGLERFARAVAERYPWVNKYTPVNEPLTTARFSGLYGHWYPHGHDHFMMAYALLNECKATALAMRAIRQINPEAQFIGTEDLAKVHSTPVTKPQADYENTRRWLGYDMLCGMVDQNHPLWNYLLGVGIAESDLLWLVENPCPPDIMGFNYYLTSERYLDDRLHLFPPWLPLPSHGMMTSVPYMDVAAVHVCGAGVDGPATLLKEAWDRYGIPLALTEVHSGSTREEQVRWLVDVFDSVSELPAEGVDVRAVTAWGLLGSHNWNSLVTRDEDYYEPGVFDLRASSPRPTLLAKVLRDWSNGIPPTHPILCNKGWWWRSVRLFHQEECHTPVNPTGWLREARDRSPQCPILITGANGRLGKTFIMLCEMRGIAYVPLTHTDLDISDERAVENALDTYQPWAVINAAGYTSVEDAERNVEACYRSNVVGAATLAQCCAARSIQLVSFSSDMVFDGFTSTPYVESDPANPVNFLGATKLQADRDVLNIMPNALVVRTSALYSPWDKDNFILRMLRHAQNGELFFAADDVFCSPTFTVDLVHNVLDLMMDEECGVWHLVNQGSVPWADFARGALQMIGLDSGCVQAQSVRGMQLSCAGYSPLASERGNLLSSVENALSRYLAYVADDLRNPPTWQVMALAMESSMGRRDLLSL
jgi:dTDP-4-dehydrorhamnose reductase